MPGQYAEPGGQILLAWHGEELAGGAAVRPLDDLHICEMKRLYLKESWRGRGIGTRLTEHCLYFARNAGYSKMRLDTELRLTTAIHIYRKLGFREIERYYENPMDTILYMEKDLQ